MAPQCKLELVNKTDTPPYALTCVGDRYVIVGGGGGSAKTGVKNKFMVYQLYHTGEQTTGRCVLSHDVGEYCISNMTAWIDKDSSEEAARIKAKGQGRGYTTPCPTIMLAYGYEEACVLVRLTPRLVTSQPVEKAVPPATQSNEDGNVRQRKTKASKSTFQNPPSPAKNGYVCSDAYFTFTVKELAKFTSVFSRPPPSSSPGLGAVAPGRSVNEEIYQKVCRVTRDCNRLVTGGTDGRVRVWSLVQMPPKLVLTIEAHQKAVDQLDVSPDGTHVVSVCKGQRECSVWSSVVGKQVLQLALDTQGLKYNFAWARYGCVEGDVKTCRLFTISNILSGTKHPGIVCKWDKNKHYALQRRQTVEGVLSNLAVTTDGRYIATGTMNGDIVVMVAFSLQVLQRLSDAHAHFVTGLEWLPDCSRTSCIVRGFSDASVLSISCDNSTKITHVSSVTMMPVWLAAVLAAVVLCLTFVLASYLGL
ncbi:WD40-repeat-containing domain [Trinorchestia longiramus]|nr:WD40-repeat-containing domain [Trinorchestia longiramus]